MIKAGVGLSHRLEAGKHEPSLSPGNGSAGFKFLDRDARGAERAILLRLRLAA